MKQKPRELPLGISDFQLVRKQDYYYVDKTMFIPKMESAGNYLFLVRPRRFGKTLFLSMLESYYDCKQADRYNELFNGLWIQENATKRRGMYQVLKLDFSQIAGPIDHLEENFNEYCNIQLNLFAQKYADMYDEGYVEEVKEYKEAVSKLIFICGKAKACSHPLYLIVDEYDNFTNTVLSVQGRNIYHDLTHGEGFYRDIFKIFKSNFERILMLGVSPVTLDDLTSGYNIATNITAEHPFNMMLGLSETEVREMLAYYHEAGLLQDDVETMIQEMKPWYDNYCFSVDSLDRDPKVFNVYMVMYYLRERLETGRSPEKMLAPNTGIDYTKLQQLLLLDSLTDRRKSTIFEILEKGYVYGNLIDHFPADRLADADNFTSLLYYYGMLTITGRRGFSLKLSIPNNNVRKQYYEYLLKEYENIKLVDISQLQMGV